MSDDAHCWDDLLGPQERLVAGNYARRTEMGSRPALLLIDLYSQVFGDRPEPIERALDRHPASCGYAAWEALEPLQRLLAAARSAELPVFHVTGEDRPEARRGSATRRLVDKLDATTDGFEIIESMRPVEGEGVIYKTRASGFFGTPLSTWLRLEGVDSLVVGGETTSGCVRASVVDAFSHGFKVMVCEDAVFDRSPLSHKASLFDMHLKYATVTWADRAEAYLRDTQMREVSMR